MWRGPDIDRAIFRESNPRSISFIKEFEESGPHESKLEERKGFKRPPTDLEQVTLFLPADKVQFPAHTMLPKERAV